MSSAGAEHRRSTYNCGIMLITAVSPAIILTRVGVEKQPKKITVLVQPEQFERFDAYCQSRGYKKSTLICRLIRDHLEAAGFHIQDELAFPNPRRRGRES
jgi:hypothetical protein